MRRMIFGLLLLIGLVACSTKSDLQIVRVTAPGKVLAGQSYQVTIDMHNYGKDTAINVEVLVSIVNTQSTRVLFGRTEKDTVHIDLSTVTGSWKCELNNSPVHLGIVQSTTQYRCNIAGLPKGAAALSFMVNTPEKLQDFPPQSMEHTDKLNFIAASYLVLTHINAFSSIDTVRTNNTPTSSPTTHVSSQRLLGGKCENDQYCANRASGLKAQCRENVCVPLNNTGARGEYCHHNNHCKNQCICRSGQTDILGWCPDWESRAPNNRGSCS